MCVPGFRAPSEAASAIACAKRQPLVKQSSVARGQPEAPEPLDFALSAHARSDDVAIDANPAVGMGADIEAVIIIERGAAILQLGADSAVVAQNEIDAILSRSEEHTSELQSLMRISYAVFCLKK